LPISVYAGLPLQDFLILLKRHFRPIGPGRRLRQHRPDLYRLWVTHKLSRQQREGGFHSSLRCIQFYQSFESPKIALLRAVDLAELLFGFQEPSLDNIQLGQL
jgi:hypothetical protein